MPGAEAEEDATPNDGRDQTVVPADANVASFTITVDRAPFMSDGAVGTITVAVADAPKTVGHVFDEALSEIEVSYTPAIGDQNDHGGIAEITLGDTDTDSTPNRRPISVNGINPGTVTLTVKATEGGTQENQPIQSATHTITVTVTP